MSETKTFVIVLPLGMTWEDVGLDGKDCTMTVGELRAQLSRKQVEVKVIEIDQTPRGVGRNR